MTNEYTETNALIAAMCEDVDALEKLVGEMLPMERRMLSDACDLLQDRLSNRCVVCDGHVPIGVGYVASYRRGVRLVHHSRCDLTEEIINKWR